MKIRAGFVSNSSSSSFICAVCKEIDYGDLYEMEVCSCVSCSCEFHIHCSPNPGLLYELIYDQHKVDIYNVPREFCPICSFASIDSYDRFLYLCKKLNISPNLVDKEIFDRFIDYDEFKKFIKGK